MYIYIDGIQNLTYRSRQGKRQWQREGGLTTHNAQHRMQPVTSKSWPRRFWMPHLVGSRRLPLSPMSPWSARMTDSWDSPLCLFVWMNWIASLLKMLAIPWLISTVFKSATELKLQRSCQNHSLHARVPSILGASGWFKEKVIDAGPGARAPPSAALH